MTEDEYDKLPHVWTKPDSIQLRNRRRWPAAPRGNGLLDVRFTDDGGLQVKHNKAICIPPPDDDVIELNRTQALALYRWLGHRLEYP